jgi:hypothetical protein
MEAIIKEAGNGFPTIGDVLENDEGCFKVVSCNGVIHTRAFGKPNYIYATVEPTQDSGDIFPAHIVFEFEVG